MCTRCPKTSVAEWVGAQGEYIFHIPKHYLLFCLGKHSNSCPSKGRELLLICCSHRAWPCSCRPKQKKGKKGNCFGERRRSALANGPRKDFQLPWDLLCAAIAFLLITSLRKYHKAKSEGRARAKTWGPQVTSERISAAAKAEKRNRHRCLLKGWSSISTRESFQGEVVKL